MAYISIKNLRKTYQVTRTEKQEVLKGVDVEFNRGEFVALLGESGCGKSTFLNILAGLDFDYTGSIIFKENFIRDFTEKDLDEYRKHRVGTVFQNFNLIKQMTAFENVVMPMTLTKATPEERKAQAEELLEMVGLADHMHKYPAQLSGGQKQRVAIARALANNPTILLADEPTGNLDPQASEEVLEILRSIAENGRLVICVTHSERVAENCTRILRMEDGIITQEEKRQKLQRKDSGRLERTAIDTKDGIDKKEIMNFAWNNIKQNMKRSILVTTALGIGICAFVLMFFLSVGMRNYVENELTTDFNKHQINVFAGRNAANIFGDFTTPQQINNTVITSHMGYINAVASMHNATVHPARIINNFRVTYGNNPTSATTTNNRILSVATFYEGFTASNLLGNTRITEIPNNDMGIIISSGMMETVGMQNGGEFTIGDPIYLSFNNGTPRRFNIIGVMNDNDGFETAFISMHGMNQLGFTTNNMAYIIANRVADIPAIINDINFDETRLFAFQPDTLAMDVMNYIEMGSLILTIVSAISLVVSAIMIFIVMYISVLERNKEIGILRAIGTRRRDVRRIFVTEAGIIGLVAGFAGVLLAIIIGLFTNLGAGSALVGITWWAILLGLGVSFAVSILSSLGPANAGASQDPIEALRANE